MSDDFCSDYFKLNSRVMLWCYFLGAVCIRRYKIKACVLIFVGTFTIFAPTDAAFDAVGTEAELLKDTTALANILKYHVVKGVIPSSAAKNELQLETLAGTKIRFNIYSHNHVRLFIVFIYIF